MGPWGIEQERSGSEEQGGATRGGGKMRQYNVDAEQYNAVQSTRSANQPASQPGGDAWLGRGYSVSEGRRLPGGQASSCWSCPHAARYWLSSSQGYLARRAVICTGSIQRGKAVAQVRAVQAGRGWRDRRRLVPAMRRCELCNAVQRSTHGELTAANRPACECLPPCPPLLSRLHLGPPPTPPRRPRRRCQQTNPLTFMLLGAASSLSTYWAYVRLHVLGWACACWAAGKQGSRGGMMGS